MEVTESYRGISSRLAEQYLRNLGGEPAEGEWDVEGDGWRAALSEEKVGVGPSLQLNEVTVTFEGEEAVLDELLPKFAQKAMRAGG